MSDAPAPQQTVSDYVAPKIWKDAGGGFMGNKPTAGAQKEKDIPHGEHNLQLYSLATPNGVKVTTFLEELIEIGVKEAEYDAWTINIGQGDQFGSGFVGVNPNSKIPALLDYSNDKENPVRVFESGAILLYLAEKFNKYIPALSDPKRAECLSWLFWGIGSAPYVGGGVGHFYHYAKIKLEYPINRFAMEAKRLLDVLDQRLADNKYLCGDDITVADFCVCPWFGTLVTGEIYNCQEFLQTHEYKNVIRWAKEVEARPSYVRGLRVNSWKPDGIERHSMADFEKKA